jgi:pimeloyl-ACP methyl ester carboxylesterase
MSETALFQKFNSSLENSFTVVYWDQRGAGKSFSRKVPKSSMNVEQFISDLDELVDWVRAHLNKQQVAVLGHSWGSVLGVLYAARFPEKVAAYVGAAQIGDWNAGEVASYEFAVAEAGRRQNLKALKALEAMGPPPHTASQLFSERMWIERMEGQMKPSSLWAMTRMFAGGPERSVLDLPALFRGFRFSMDAMWPALSTFNLAEHVTELSMPTVFFLGRRDRWVPPQVSVEYIDLLRAPSKEIVWFEESSHEMFVDEPARFNEAMVTTVLPLLASEARREAPVPAGAGLH